MRGLQIGWVTSKELPSFFVFMSNAEHGVSEALFCMEHFQIIKNALLAFLESHSNVLSFYIGKTDNYKRREDEHFSQEGDGYNYMWKIAEGKSDSISKMEDMLISFFKNSQYSNLLENKNSGSGGNTEATILYFCVKSTVIEIEDLGEDFVTLDGIENPINLDL